MKLEYSLIGKRIAQRRKQLGLTQSVVAERCDISDQYLSNIERSTSIPSTEVIMRLAMALDTTPDAFLVGAVKYDDNGWQAVADSLRTLSKGKLELLKSFVEWLSKQEI